ncbi:PAS domain-containing sensor histidine kinase [Exiguobacterium aurantiacum]|uniref:PAS domain-containing sensor histidine kinase n=1 Tax=Exiguobacterium aurantiacum TaxID=33987 RepID=UPI0009F5143C|nr:PAS domain-containing sensor histidine kinase [Exiguobacterium aurantiacum]
MALQDFERQILNVLKDGVIVMDHDRNIITMNEAAEQLTGWRLGEPVPYCSFCQRREIGPDEDRCYLIQHERSPYFTSEMPTYSGKMVDVEMNTARILNDPISGATYYLLVLRDFTERKRREAHALREQMVWELIRAREEEHERLAQELHDGVGQSLFSIALALGALQSDVSDPDKKDYIESVLAEVGRLIDNVRGYSKQLRPIELDQFGLGSALNVLVDSFATRYPLVTFRTDIRLADRYERVIEINVYRIVQEALVNSMKYAQASTIDCRIVEHDGQIDVLFKDDGNGFDQQRVAKGLGLRHMEERTKTIHGTFTLESVIGQGTEISVSVPIERGRYDTD